MFHVSGMRDRQLFVLEICFILKCFSSSLSFFLCNSLSIFCLCLYCRFDLVRCSFLLLRLNYLSHHTFHGRSDCLLGLIDRWWHISVFYRFWDHHFLGFRLWSRYLQDHQNFSFHTVLNWNPYHSILPEYQSFHPTGTCYMVFSTFFFCWIRCFFFKKNIYNG